jgi:dihydroflavonol-4-reductase
VTKILLTGGSGFLGSHILDSLSVSGHNELIALYRATKPKRGENDSLKIEWIKGDIHDVVLLEDIMKQVDVVIHAAGNVSMRKQDRKMVYHDNVNGTANIANIALDSGIKKLVHISSSAALGRRKERETINESAKWTDSPFNSYYGITKFYAEQEVWRAYHEGLNTTILSPTMIVGPTSHFHRSSVKLVDAIANGLKYYPTGSNGFVDVRDVAAAALLAMKGEFDGNRYLLNGCNLGYRELMVKIAEELEVPAPFRKIDGLNKTLAKLMAWYSDRFSQSGSFISRDSLMTGSLEMRYDASLSESELGASYRPVNNTIKDMVEAYKMTKG